MVKVTYLFPFDSGPIRYTSNLANGKGAGDQGEALRRLPLNIGKPLASITSLHKLVHVLCVGNIGRSIIALSKHFVCQSRPSRMVSTHSFVDLPQNV